MRKPNIEKYKLIIKKVKDGFSHRDIQTLLKVSPNTIQSAIKYFDNNNNNNNNNDNDNKKKLTKPIDKKSESRILERLDMLETNLSTLIQECRIEPKTRKLPSIPSKSPPISTKLPNIGIGVNRRGLNKQEFLQSFEENPLFLKMKKMCDETN